MTRARLWIAAGILSAFAAGAGWYQWDARARPAPRSGPVTIPVVAVRPQLRDVPIFLTGLGTVTAFNRVTVHVRVDGELQAVDFVEGQNVKQGDKLAQIDPRPFQAQLDQAKAAKARDEAQLANARLDLDRFMSLAAKEYATRQSVDTQKAMIAQLEAAIRGDQAAIENSETQLGYTTITSPLDGRTGMRLVDRGNIVHASDPGGLVVITQVRPIALIFSLPQDDLHAVTKAFASGPLRVFAYARDERIAEGTLVLIDNQVDAATGTVRLKAVFPNDDDALWPGQIVQARLELAVRHDAVTVPSEAIQRGPNDLYAYIIKPDSTVDRRAVRLGPIQDGVAVVESGLSPDDRVVVDGQFKLKPGARVAIAGEGNPLSPPSPERKAAPRG